MLQSECLAETPDIETSSAEYASRFAGRAGRYLLDVQDRAVAQAVTGLAPGAALDVGGGHGQLVEPLSRLGWKVTVHGTAAVCERNLRDLHGKRDCGFLLGKLSDLPVADRSFDIVLAVRLLAHVSDWRLLVKELCRVADRSVIVDYPSKQGLNALTPMLFGLKKLYEKNTRSYFSFTRRELETEFERHGFVVNCSIKQLFLPMVLHRAGKGSAALRWAESLCKMSGLTAVAGSPVILRVDRKT